VINVFFFGFAEAIPDRHGERATRSSSLRVMRDSDAHPPAGSSAVLAQGRLPTRDPPFATVATLPFAGNSAFP
jgi:hypothetical protein